MTDNTSSPGSEIEIPEEIAKWILAAVNEQNNDFEKSGIDFNRCDFGLGAEAMYRHLYPLLKEKDDSTMEAIDQWVKDNEKWPCEEGQFSLGYRTGFLFAAQRIKNMYRKAKDQALGFDRQLKAKDNEIADKNAAILHRDHSFKTLLDKADRLEKENGELRGKLEIATKAACIEKTDNSSTHDQ